MTSRSPELAGKGITVNAVAPGLHRDRHGGRDPRGVKEPPAGPIPLKRFGKAEEVARAVIYLVSSDGEYITGEELSMNGGLLMR